MELPNRAEVRSQISSKFPGLPNDTLDWVAGMLSDKIEADWQTADAEFHREMERAIRAGEEHAILVALAALKAV